MNKFKFIDLLSLSTQEIIEEISTIELKVFNLRLKKATRQVFKASELKFSKKKLAQLKTLLTQRINEMKEKEKDTLTKLIGT